MTKIDSTRVVFVNGQQLEMAERMKACTDLEIVGTAANAREALCLCMRTAPHVLVVDLMMPDIDGLMLARIVRRYHPSVRIVVLTHSDQRDLLESALQTGAAVYLSSRATSKHIRRAIQIARRQRETIVFIGQEQRQPLDFLCV